ncbi:hypothetical protein SAY87_029940 [Trapa incisa]|uniref:Uncharacterized protein n=1 Tax=Trapa incisa TaxID=236973 RepID=A0AAN7K8H1_9MYRT|nr:hypothetical protein SAY87_029940 [Trapa incisa]
MNPIRIPNCQKDASSPSNRSRGLVPGQYGWLLSPRSKTINGGIRVKTTSAATTHLSLSFPHQESNASKNSDFSSQSRVICRYLPPTLSLSSPFHIAMEFYLRLVPNY